MANYFNTQFYKRKLPPQLPNLEDKLGGAMTPSYVSPTKNQQNQDQEEPQYDTNTHDEINSLIDAPLKSAVSMRLQNLLSQYPTPEQYKPSKKRQVLAAIAGGMTGATHGGEAGAKLATDIVENPYKTALTSWEAKYKPAQESYNIEQTANKTGFSNLSNYADYVKKMADVNPELQGRIEGAKASSKEKVEQPNRIALKNVETLGQKEVANINQTGANKRNQSTIEAENQRNTENVTGRKNVAGLEISARAEQGKLDRASRELIAANELRLRRELDKGNKITRVPIDQQVKARLDAEDQVLSGRAGVAGLKKINTDELKGIAIQAKDDKGNPIGWMLKSEADVDPLWKDAWKIRKEQAQNKAEDMLNSTFPDKSGKNEDDWVDVSGR